MSRFHYGFLAGMAVGIILGALWVLWLTGTGPGPS